MPKTYRIRRVEDDGALLDLLKNVLFGAPAPQPAPLDGGVSFDAIADQRIVGSMTLRRPAAGAAVVERLAVDADHQARGCREALLDVALQWARANELHALQVTAPAADADFYLANGFHVVGGLHEPGASSMRVVLSQALAGARPHTDAWFSKHHGQWFASMAPH